MGIRFDLLHRHGLPSGAASSLPRAAAHGSNGLAFDATERYERGHVRERVATDTVEGAPDRSHSLSSLTVIAKYWFKDGASPLTPPTPPDGSAPVRLDHMQMLTGHEHEVIAARRGGIKRVSILTRRRDLSPERFRDDWFGRHATLVRSLPGCTGYVQNWIDERFLGTGKPVTHDEMPWDGIAELWFDDLSAMRAAYSSSARAALRVDARKLVRDIATFIVEMEPSS